jgi:hypothetical protein
MIGLPASTKIWLAANTTNTQLFREPLLKVFEYLFLAESDIRSTPSSCMNGKTVSRLSAVQSNVGAPD